jgi:hypothetical protein
MTTRWIAEKRMPRLDAPVRAAARAHGEGVIFMDSTAESVQPIEVTACMCAEGACTSGRAGHTVLPIQERVAAASPTAWRDAIVDRTDARGWIELVLLESERRVWVWSHQSSAIASGTPVALHRAAGVASLPGGTVSVLVRG